MNIFIFISMIAITGLISVVILTLFFQGQNNTSLGKQDDLEEWDCPLCGFHMQMGNVCTYCYTKKKE